jgi:dienelactone hydrolase
MKKLTRIKIPAALAILAFAFALDAPAQQTTPAKIPTPPEVWKNYDPDAGDFKEEIVREETKDGIYYRDSFISAYVNGHEVRVFCKYAVKADAKNAPGLLNVHGWYAAPAIDMDLVKDGWAVLAHDYNGKNSKWKDRTEYTKYPKELVYGNMDQGFANPEKYRPFDPTKITDPTQAPDYLWNAIQRRALSYLLVQKEVDKTRIGAKGFSYGGTIIWNLGMDPRVKAIVSYFGSGWLDYYRAKGVFKYKVPYTEPPKTPTEEMILTAVAPEAHSPYITAATLWLNGTNDHHGGHERGEDNFKMFKPGVPWDFAHQARAHHDTSKLGNNAKLWLEKHVLGKDIAWPARPVTEIKLDADGVPEFHIKPGSPEKIESLEVYNSFKESNNVARLWLDAKAEKKGDTWVAKIPVRNVNDYVFAFANLRYPGGIVISTNFTAAIPAQLGKAVATRVDAPDGTESWSEVGPAEVAGVKGFRPLNNRSGTTCIQFGEPKRKAPEGAVMELRFYCTQPQTIILTANRYSTPIEITASNDWQTLEIPAERLRFGGAHGPLGSWSAVTTITLQPKPGSDITKVVFAEPTWKIPAK